MGSTLSQAEINALLSALDQPCKPRFETIVDFEQYLLERKNDPESSIGMFTQDVSVCRFRQDVQSNHILQTIIQKNKKNGSGTICIPGTKIELVNYSFCHECKQIYSFQELIEYYSNPICDNRFSSRGEQLRNDTRVVCGNCGTQFIPAILINEQYPKNQIQFLCRLQTVEAVERFCEKEFGQPVLTKKKSNYIKEGDRFGILNDLSISQLVSNQTLIANIIQYTPVNLIVSFIRETNIQNRDLLFGHFLQ